MSKVVHLSNEAHAQAKVYCKSRGLKMSDWVGALIIEAITENEETKPPEPQVESTAPRKKKLPKTDDTVQSTEQGVPVYSQPPFWAKQTIGMDPDDPDAVDMGAVDMGAVDMGADDMGADDTGADEELAEAAEPVAPQEPLAVTE